MIAAFRPIAREFELAHLRWALREIDLLHPDVPRIVLRIQDLEAERQEADRPLVTPEEAMTWPWLALLFFMGTGAAATVLVPLFASLNP